MPSVTVIVLVIGSGSLRESALRHNAVAAGSPSSGLPSPSRSAGLRAAVQAVPPASCPSALHPVRGSSPRRSTRPRAKSRTRRKSRPSCAARSKSRTSRRTARPPVPVGNVRVGCIGRRAPGAIVEGRDPGAPELPGPARTWPLKDRTAPLNSTRRRARRSRIDRPRSGLRHHHATRSRNRSQPEPPQPPALHSQPAQPAQPRVTSGAAGAAASGAAAAGAVATAAATAGFAAQPAPPRLGSANQRSEPPAHSPRHSAPPEPPQPPAARNHRTEPAACSQSPEPQAPDEQSSRPAAAEAQCASVPEQAQARRSRAPQCTRSRRRASPAAAGFAAVSRRRTVQPPPAATLADELRALRLSLPPLQDRLQRIARLRHLRQVERRRLRLRREPSPHLPRTAVAEVAAHFFRLIGLDRARVRLALRHANRRQRVQNGPALDFKLSCEIVDSNFAHPSLFLPRPASPARLAVHISLIDVGIVAVLYYP